MEEWMCSQCGLYQKVNPADIKSGRKVFFYQNAMCVRSVVAGTNDGVIRGVVLRREKNFLIILGGGQLFKIKDIEVFPENAPTSFVYNMFGTCEC